MDAGLRDFIRPLSRRIDTRPALRGCEEWFAPVFVMQFVTMMFDVPLENIGYLSGDADWSFSV